MIGGPYGGLGNGAPGLHGRNGGSGTPERAGGVLQDSWVPTGQIPPTPKLVQAGTWKQQHTEAAGPWDAGWNGEEWSGRQVESPGWAALGAFPLPQPPH